MRRFNRRPAHQTMELHEDGHDAPSGPTSLAETCAHCRRRNRLRAADGVRMSRFKLIRWMRGHGFDLIPSQALADDYGTRQPADFHHDGDE